MTFQRLPARTALGTLCLQPCPPLPLSHTLIGSVPFQVLTSTLPSKLSPSQDATGIRTSALLFAGSRRSNEPLATLRTSATCNHAASVDPTRANGRILDLLTKNASASHPVPNTRPQLHPRPRGSRTDPRVDQTQLTAEALVRRALSERGAVAAARAASTRSGGTTGASGPAGSSTQRARPSPRVTR